MGRGNRWSLGENTHQSFSESLQLLKWAKEAGLDLVDVGLALTSANDPVPWGPNFMVPYAERVRRAACGSVRQPG